MNSCAGHNKMNSDEFISLKFNDLHGTSIPKDILYNNFCLSRNLRVAAGRFRGDMKNCKLTKKLASSWFSR